MQWYLNQMACSVVDLQLTVAVIGIEVVARDVLYTCRGEETIGEAEGNVMVETTS